MTLQIIFKYADIFLASISLFSDILRAYLLLNYVYPFARTRLPVSSLNHLPFQWYRVFPLLVMILFNIK
jgi:hypothetical protein